MTRRRTSPTLSRRDALRGLAAGAVGVAAAGALPLEVLAGPGAPSRAKGARARVRSVVEIWMSGGPSHLETFDPKPEAGSDYCGPLSHPIETKAGGVRIGELLPELAKQGDRFSLIRSMSHGIDGHETATYVVQTGRKPGEDGIVYPSLGAIVSALRGYDAGYEGLIPPWIELTTPLGRFTEVGFLGLRHKPFVTGGDPRQPRFAVEGVVAEGITDERQRSRRELLHDLDTLGRALPDHPQLARLDRTEEKAYDLILGDAGKVFHLGLEADAVRERYGRTVFGQSCLAARRLVEAGVPYVTVHTTGWDTHRRHFESMRGKLSELDRGTSALIGDLSDRGLLESTIVWCCGEFGRTPKVQWEEPWNGGRGHHGRCFSALVAGGAFRGGRVLGSTDARGESVKDRPVHPRELLGSICSQMGIDPDGPLANPKGLDVKVMPSLPDDAGRPRLRELVG